MKTTLIVWLFLSIGFSILLETVLGVWAALDEVAIDHMFIPNTHAPQFSLRLVVGLAMIFAVASMVGGNPRNRPIT